VHFNCRVDTVPTYLQNLPKHSGAKEALRIYKNWESFLQEHNERGPKTANKAFETSPVWIPMMTQEVCIKNIVFGLASSTSISFGSVLLFTGSIYFMYS